MKKLYLIDGSGYIFRAFYGMARDRTMRLAAADGTPTNAVFTFNNMLQRLLKDVGASPDVLVGIAFDVGRKSFRTEIYPEYKATRQSMPEDLAPQIPLIHELVRAYDIPILVVEGYEADDTLATLARKGVAAGYAVTLVSADKDLMQLVSPALSMWDPMKDAHYDREGVKEKWGVYPEQLGDYLALVGDTSDNVPGVPKVGDKTAVGLITQFGTLDALLARTAEIEKKSIRETIEAHKEEALLSKKLVTLCETVPIELDEARLHYRGPKREKLAPLFKRLSFADKKLEEAMAFGGAVPSGTALGPSPAPTAAPVEGMALPTATTDLVSHAAYVTVLDEAALKAMAADLKSATHFALDTETTSLDPMRAEIVGMSFCARDGHAYYVPVSHRYLGAPKQLPLSLLRDVLGPVIAEGAIVGQNLKYDMHVLRNAGFQFGRVADDALLLSYVLDPGRESHKLDYFARILLGHENVRFDSLVGKGKSKTFDEVTVEQAAIYAAEDADVTLRICRLLRAKLTETSKEMLALYEDIELPLLRVLYHMEHAGIAVDPQAMSALGVELRTKMNEIHKEITAIAGDEVNINSPKQLATVLFDKLQLPVIKRTSSGPSTDMSVLEALAEQHPLPQKILDFRQVQKLLSTYVETLPQLVHPQTHRVHTSYNQAGAATGRLSSNDPNLQNIPVKTDLGRRIRAAFVAQKGWQFVSADFSQIELRMLAHLSGDEALIAAFKSGFDIHANTASKLFSVPQEEVTPIQRRRAKAVNFGLLYGMSAFRLSREEGVTIAEAKSFIEAYFAAFPSVRAFMDSVLESGRSKGYIETIMGRRRYLPDLRSKNHTARQAAERVALNTPIQGSAADLVKLAMLKLHRELAEMKMQTRMLLQVHDELVLEAPEAEIDRARALVARDMKTAMKLKVPLEVSVSVGGDWSQVH
ncbi:MAG: DNA polymerase I [Deltaproteobacteria bacterium]|nr:DNA polymerase I [Deltaproteobacteria bacterium]